MKTALMGASGFVGSRMVEMFHLGGAGEVRPIVRSFGALARLARFDLDWRLADAADEAALAKAFEGCETVVHSVYGHFDIVEGSIAPSYRAACRAGVKRMVYLSTASVHGQAPASGTDETSALSDRQPTDYNNRKVRAERLLLGERGRGATEIVIIRPGIVFGPRDRWNSGSANDLLHGTAVLVGGGAGICNTIYVDNLVHAIRLALAAPGADREAFLVGDREAITWADLYHRVAVALGVPPDEIHDVAPPEFRRTLRDRADHIRSHKAAQAVLPYIPGRLKRMAKAALAAWPEQRRGSPWALPGPPAPVVTREMADLHQCPAKLPWEKARRILGYEPPVTLDEGLRRTFGWLAFAGCPTVPAA